jgi:hypothetical protein
MAKKIIGTQSSTVRTIEQLEVTLRNKPGSLLVTHVFAEKAKQEIRDKHLKKAKGAKEVRDPNAEFLAARYVNADGLECVPITAIKKSLITAATSFDDLTKVALRQSVFADCVEYPGADMVPIRKHNGEPAVATRTRFPHRHEAGGTRAEI